eukprot:8102906-Pyramimonas_sp.AAC.1
MLSSALQLVPTEGICSLLVLARTRHYCSPDGQARESDRSRPARMRTGIGPRRSPPPRVRTGPAGAPPPSDPPPTRAALHPTVRGGPPEGGPKRAQR